MQYLRSRKSNDQESRHNDRWLISYADLVTLLLALFIVLYAASDHDRAVRIAQSFSSRNTGGTGILPGNDQAAETDAEARITQNPVLMQKTKMRKTARGLIVSLSEAGFFAPGEATVSPEAENVIKVLAESLRDAPMPIRVEGHTDSVPISNSQYRSNWELSTARASSVLTHLIDNGIPPEKLSAAGYSGFQPVADNATAEGRAQNRRVDIVVLNR